MLRNYRDSVSFDHWKALLKWARKEKKKENFQETELPDELHSSKMIMPQMGYRSESTTNDRRSNQEGSKKGAIHSSGAYPIATSRYSEEFPPKSNRDVLQFNSSKNLQNIPQSVHTMHDKNKDRNTSPMSNFSEMEQQIDSSTPEYENRNNTKSIVIGGKVTNAVSRLRLQKEKEDIERGRSVERSSALR